MGKGETEADEHMRTEDGSNESRSQGLAAELGRFPRERGSAGSGDTELLVRA